MPDVYTEIDYLQNLPLYEKEKPYYALLSPTPGFDPDAERLDNLEFETKSGILVKDIRNRIEDFTLEKQGFQVLPHHSQLLEKTGLDFQTLEQVKEYKLETEELLTKTFGAVYVHTYDFRTRKNIALPRSVFNVNDPLLLEGPALGAHCDVTFHSGPVIINRYLSEEIKELYLKPGYRLRIVNTWRPLLPRLEDRPLALCDNRSINPDDLIAADRILPDRIGEIYYLTYSQHHRWHWLEGQTPEELFSFIMYDTKAGNHAKLCPHVSFNNPRKGPDAPPRSSVETRSVIITREE